MVQFKKKEEYPYKHAYKLLPIESKILFQEWDNLQVHEDTVYRQKQQQPRRLISPSKVKPLVYKYGSHVNMGYPGTDRTTELIKSRFYEPLMDDEIKHFVTQVFPSVKEKIPNNESSSNTDYINI